MQIEQAGQAEREFARAFRKRQRERRVGRQSDQRREQQVAAFLRAERPGSRRPRHEWPADALEQQRVEPAHRVPEEVQREPHFGGADDPADETQCERLRDLRTIAVQRADRVVDRIGAGGQRRPVARAEQLRREAQAAAEQSAPLRCIERDGEGAEHAGGDQRGRAQVRDRFVRRIQAERGDADQRERHLRERLHRRADRDGCRRVGHPRAALREVAHHQHRAADLPGGQQAVHRFADPARAQRIAELGARLAGAEHHGDRDRVDRERHDVERRDERGPSRPRGTWTPRRRRPARPAVR